MDSKYSQGSIGLVIKGNSSVANNLQLKLIINI